MLDALDPRPDGLIVASPCNPAGTMLHPDELAAIAAWCDREGVRLISDEIYHGLNYDAPISDRRRVQPHAIVVNSFSKYFSMTGWRVGWLVLPEDLVRPVECLAQNLFISAPHISQVAAEAAFDCTTELAGEHRALPPLARPPAATRCRAPGSPGSPAEGAFYLYADVADRTNDSLAFCARMLAEAGVAASPGRRFRPHPRQPLRAVQLLRSRGGHGRGRAATGRLAIGQGRLVRDAHEARCSSLSGYVRPSRDAEMAGADGWDTGPA